MHLYAARLPISASVRIRTKPAAVDLHEACKAMLYLLKSGCQCV
jgi:hypothetical protein